MNKIPVDVEVEVRRDGEQIPKAVIWSDGRRFTISRVVYHCIGFFIRSNLFHQFNPLRWRFSRLCTHACFKRRRCFKRCDIIADISRERGALSARWEQ